MSEKKTKPKAKPTKAKAPKKAEARVSVAAKSAAKSSTKPHVSGAAKGLAAAPRLRTRRAKRQAVLRAKFAVGEVVRHRFYPFRGVIFDIDPVFANTEDWWLAIPEKMRPRKDQPFYHLLAENAETEYIAYVSEQNLLPDTSGLPIRHPQVPEFFVEDDEGRYRPVIFTRLN